MRRLALLGCLFLVAADWPIHGPEGLPTPETVDPSTLFAPEDVDWWSHEPRTDARALAATAESARGWIYRHDTAHEPVPHGFRDALGISESDVRDTLDFIARIAREDTGRPSQRLEDPAFLTAHFRAYRWTGDAESAGENNVALHAGQVRITKYLVYQHHGSAVPTEVYNTGLYGIPHEEAALDLETADALSDSLRHKYTRKQVLDGVYGPTGEAAGQAPALVWMRRADIHEALMQGTVELSMQDGSTRTFNVHRNNGVSYVRGERNPERQDRFWYFREVDGVRGWGEDPEDKILLDAGAAVAGDVDNLGLGGLFAISGNGGVRLVILADTGGAFQPNLYQLDFFAGAYPDRATFERQTADVPNRAVVYMLVRK